MATILKVKIKAHLLFTGRAVVFCCAHNDVLAESSVAIWSRVVALSSSVGIVSCVGLFLFLYVHV